MKLIFPVFYLVKYLSRVPVNLVEIESPIFNFYAKKNKSQEENIDDRERA